MSTKIYTYSYSVIRKDGSVATYAQNVKYKAQTERKKLTESDVLEIKEKLNAGITKKRICDDYGVCFSTVMRYIGKLDSVATSC